MLSKAPILRPALWSPSIFLAFSDHVVSQMLQYSGFCFNFSLSLERPQFEDRAERREASFYLSKLRPFLKKFNFVLFWFRVWNSVAQASPEPFRPGTHGSLSAAASALQGWLVLVTTLALWHRSLIHAAATTSALGKHISHRFIFNVVLFFLCEF